MLLLFFCVLPGMLLCQDPGSPARPALFTIDLLLVFKLVEEGIHMVLVRF